MTHYREIIRLTSLGLSLRNIMRSLGFAQKTVVKIQHRAKELGFEWPLDESMTDKSFEVALATVRLDSTTITIADGMAKVAEFTYNGIRYDSNIKQNGYGQQRYM